MEKMMTFEEWWNEAYGDREIPVPRVEIVKIWASQAFESARKGTIPAENAVVIPPVGEWPEENEDGTKVFGVGVVFTTFEDHEQFENGWGNCAIQYIPRPKPVWVPKVGEAVFAYNGGVPWIAKVTDNTIVEGLVGPSIKELICSDGDKSRWTLKNLKPFHESHIGKPWSEIPGGGV